MLKSEKFNIRDTFYKVQNRFELYLARIKKIKSSVKWKKPQKYGFLPEKKNGFGDVFDFYEKKNGKRMSISGI